MEALLPSLQIRATPFNLQAQSSLQWLQPGPKHCQIFGG